MESRSDDTRGAGGGEVRDGVGDVVGKERARIGKQIVVKREGNQFIL